MSLVKEQREQIRTAIIDTAVELFQEKGYEQVSVEDITKTVGVAKGTFYNYFGAKSDILMVWVERLVRQLDYTALINRQDSTVNNLHRVVDALLTCAEKERGLFQCALREVMSLYNSTGKLCTLDLKPLLRKVLVESGDFSRVGDDRLDLKVNILKNALFMEMLNGCYSGKEYGELRERLHGAVDICLNGIYER